ncbi:MAG: dienelactone hydrolase family protein [Candidatus Omnitrophica bacterium]|nr:dienelactone hydrolase family protein [Candidatus Omnitrophota bacterium]
MALVAVYLLLALSELAHGEVRTETVEYTHGDVVLEGVLAYDDAAAGPRPGVIVVHEWKGLGPYAVRRAEQLAQLGYIALAADMYGKGVRAKDHTEAAKLSGIYRKDRTLMRERIAAALDTLRRHPLADPQRLAAIGYCFGGTSVLELARSGADVAGVVSFHGSLDTPNPEDARNIKGRVLVLTGGADPNVPPEQVAAFEGEMREAGVDYRVVVYEGAVHSFTVPEAGSDPSTGAAYNAEADQRSWEAMKAFLQEAFGSSLRHIG